MNTDVQTELKLLHRKLVEVAATKCPECDGIGHTKNKCATYKRVLGLTKGLNPSRVIVNAARVAVTGNSSKTLGGFRMNWG